MKFGVIVLIISLATLLFSCGKSQEEKDRQIKQLLMNTAGGTACLSFTLTPDSVDKTMDVAVGIMEDSARLEAYIKYSDKGEPMIRETYSSFLAREISTNVGMRVTDIVLQPADAIGNFKGKALLKSGEKIIFRSNPDKGWYPEDNLLTLQTIVKHQVIKGLEKGQEMDSIGIALEAPSRYRGKYKLKSGVEQWVYVVHTGTDFSWTLSQPYTPPADAAKQPQK
jgi:hypothetical protein